MLGLNNDTNKLGFFFYSSFQFPSVQKWKTCCSQPGLFLGSEKQEKQLKKPSCIHISISNCFLLLDFGLECLCALIIVNHIHDQSYAFVKLQHKSSNFNITLQKPTKRKGNPQKLLSSWFCFVLFLLIPLLVFCVCVSEVVY